MPTKKKRENLFVRAAGEAKEAGQIVARKRVSKHFGMQAAKRPMKRHTNYTKRRAEASREIAAKKVKKEYFGP